MGSGLGEVGWYGTSIKGAGKEGGVRKTSAVELFQERLMTRHKETAFSRS
jgi:hypothetical protein